MIILPDSNNVINSSNDSITNLQSQKDEMAALDNTNKKTA